ncbi:MAG: phytanoyl-CoA dioxygenase family protein [Burkholderiales bacterium]|nr:phytanoyl-CoA dioxygenase family protein [Burkholderiales bacterium]MDE2609397.1 phytanoyl-CoA dioxygenase family protein [Burkholderiales bacterium]
MALLATQVEAFRTDGILVIRGMVPQNVCEDMLRVAKDHLARAEAPVEYEAQLGYAGAPASLDAPGGRTVRRLLQAYGRHACFKSWASDRRLVTALAQLFGEDVYLTLAHHNCVMTKHPAYGTATGWHRDIRYWSFARPDLISVWLALGPETETNGGLRFIPGSHRMDISRAQLDELDFLRPDVPENQALMAQGKTIELQQGDVVLFHSGTFHAANRNATQDTKFSVVFAYRGASNPPLAGTRSAASGEVALGC